MQDENVAKSDSFAKYYGWRGVTKETAASKDKDKLIMEFTTHSPCHCMTIRDNCFSQNPVRARELIRREFKGESERALPNVLADFMTSIRNKSLLMVGDSTLVATYASLVCHISQFVNTSHHLVWLIEPDKLINEKMGQKGCPGNIHCHIISGYTTFPDHNATITYHQGNNYSKRMQRMMWSLVEEGQHAVIVNMGVHHNAYHTLHGDLLRFNADLKTWRHSHPHISWHWMESFPQHFSGGNFDESRDTQKLIPLQQRLANISASISNSRSSSNDSSSTSISGGNSSSVSAVDIVLQGTSKRSWEKLLLCTPHHNDTYSHAQDWRNRLAESVFSDFTKNERMIRIARPLYSQWDSHVDYGDSVRGEDNMSHVKDCTHYCLGSGVFRFVISQVMTAVTRCLEGHC